MDVIWMVLPKNSVIFSPWQRTYGLRFMLWRTMNCWPPNDGRAMFHAEKALLEVASGRQCSAVQVFLGTGADYQPGCICSSDCFGNGRLVREEDRASCWATAITNLWLNVSYHCLLAQLSKLSGKCTHPFIQLSWCHILTLLGTRMDTYLWQGAGFSHLSWEWFPAPPVASEEYWSPSVSFLFFLVPTEY